VNRRQFLGRASGLGATLGLGTAFWQRALAQTAQPADSPYGPLQAPDANGLQLPAGFTSRVVASSLTLVPGTTHLWHLFPDGGACVPTDDGGWIYVSNSENPPPVDIPDVTGLLAEIEGLLGDLDLPVPIMLPTGGGVGAIRFAADGSIVDAYSILNGSIEGSISNCAGGLTPWGTWLSCEEWESDGATYDAGKVWECDPFGTEAAVDRPSLGRFKHEMAACDPVEQRIYLSEDQTDGLFYRYTPPPDTWGSGAALVGGTLEAMALAGDGSVTWVPVTGGDSPAAPLRDPAVTPGATPFVSGEGVIYDDGRVYLTTKPPDDRVWVLDVAAQTMRVLYAAGEFAEPVLNGVDNIAASAAHDLYVAEDGGNLEVCVITPELGVFPVVRMTGPQHGFDSGTPVPLLSEVTGLAFSPDGNRLYFNSERGNGLVPAPVGPGPGILYEVTGPFRGGTLAAAPAPTTTSTTTAAATTAPTTAATTRGTLPATGSSTDRLGPGLVAAAGAAALWHLRRRADQA
jgi:hypothetical protein